MLKAEKLLRSGLACRFIDYEETAASIMCLEAITKDLAVLLSIYHDKLVWLIREHEVGDVFAGWSDSEVAEVLDHCKIFYAEAYDGIQSFITEANELLSMYHVSVPAISHAKEKFAKEAKSNNDDPETTGSAMPSNITTQMQEGFRAYDTSLEYLNEFPSPRELRSTRKASSSKKQKREL
jgi:hypothetical protein